MTAADESAYRCCFETCESLEDNKKKQTLPLKAKYLEAFDNDIKRMLQEKSKVLRWVVDKVLFLRAIESFRTECVGYWKDIFRAYESSCNSTPERTTNKYKGVDLYFFFSKQASFVPAPGESPSKEVCQLFVPVVGCLL